MSSYSAKDIERADRLWDEHPKHVVAEKTGVSEGALNYWSEQGWISTDTDHRTAAVRKYPEETIERADELWDSIPLTEVSDLIDVPLSVLYNWSQYGWIDTDTVHSGRYQTEGMEKKVKRAARLAHDTDLTNRDAAKKMGVAESTYYRYLRLYRQGKYV